MSSTVNKIYTINWKVNKIWLSKIWDLLAEKRYELNYSGSIKYFLIRLFKSKYFALVVEYEFDVKTNLKW